jgi:hypothetical protein
LIYYKLRVSCFAGGNMDIVIGGIYTHYKGNQYKVISLATHSETLESMVVYQALYGEGGIWVRPAGMWNELVEINGTKVPRFRLTEGNL